MTEVTIIIPIYNAAKWLRRCLDSIKKQTFQNFECLLVDDCSTDGSFKIANEYATNDKRFKVFQTEKNSGTASKARNIGLDNAKGAYISFIDSDDYISNNFIARLLSVLKEQKVRIVACSSDVTTLSNKKRCWFKGSGFKTVKEMYEKGPDIAAVTNVLFSRDLIGDIRFQDFKYAEDLIFNWKVLNKIDGVYFIPDEMYHHEEHSTGLSKTVDMKEIKRVADYVNNEFESPYIDIYKANLKNRKYFRDLVD